MKEPDFYKKVYYCVSEKCLLIKQKADKNLEK